MFSVIIPSLNSPLINQVVSALEAQTAQQQIREIIIVGQDHQQLIPASATFIKTERPISAAMARNLGARYATGKYLLFIDADCIACPGLIEAFYRHCHQGHQIVSGSITPEPHPYWRLCDNLLVFPDLLNTSPPGTRSALPSLNLLIERQTFFALNGFDERFPGAAGEDFDFSLRAQQQGLQLHFEPSASIYHRPQRSSAKSIWNHLRGFGRAHYHVLCKHKPDHMTLRLRRLMPALLFSQAALLAWRDTTQLFASHPVIRYYYRAFPGMVWAKIGWYWGFAEAIRIHS